MRLSVKESNVRYWERHFPHAKKPETHLRNFFAETFRPGTVVLDAGCGHRSSVRPDGPHFRVSLDLDMETLLEDSNREAPVRGALEKIPLKDASVDAIVSEFVLEHLENPPAVFAEFARVLKPGGALVFVTTNASSYISRLVRLVPFGLQIWIKHRLLKMQDVDIMPVHYRCNTKAKLEAALGAAGFRPEKWAFIGAPFYFGFSTILFRLAVWIEKMTEGERSHLKFYVVGRFGKSG